jgi:hypothetical protein
VSDEQPSSALCESGLPVVMARLFIGLPPDSPFLCAVIAVISSFFCLCLSLSLSL